MNADSTIQSTGLSSRAPTRLDDNQLCRTLRSALGLKYNLRDGHFVFTAPGHVGGTEISENALLVLLAKTLAAQPELFPVSQIRPRRLKRIIHLLRALCVDASEDAVHELQEFVERRVVLQPGSDVTSGQMYAAYVQHTGDSLLTQFEFFRCLPSFIKRRFGLTQSHQIFRPDVAGRLTMRRGWRGLTLKDGTDAEDAEDGNLNSHPNPKP